MKEGEGGDDPSKHLVLVWWGRIEVESRKMPRFLNKYKNVGGIFEREKKEAGQRTDTLPTDLSTDQPTNDIQSKKTSTSNRKSVATGRFGPLPQ